MPWRLYFGALFLSLVAIVLIVQLAHLIWPPTADEMLVIEATAYTAQFKPKAKTLIIRPAPKPKPSPHQGQSRAVQTLRVRSEEHCMTDDQKGIAQLIALSLGGALVGAVLWGFGVVPWWTIIIGAVAPVIVAAGIGLLFVMAWMASGSH